MYPPPFFFLFNAIYLASFLSFKIKLSQLRNVYGIILFLLCVMNTIVLFSQEGNKLLENSAWINSKFQKFGMKSRTWCSPPNLTNLGTTKGKFIFL